MHRVLISAVIAVASVCAAGSAHAALVISNAATKHVNCAAGVCTPTAKNAVLNVSQLQGLLAASDVSVNTAAGAVTIGVSAPLTWASTSRLTLNAANGVAIKAAVVVEGTGALTIAASGGALNFYPGGSISFWDNTSSLIIGGQSYTLVSDIATLASDVMSNPSGFYALAKNYDASGDSFSAAPLNTFGGIFEGLGNTISNMTIDAAFPRSVGLFEEVDGTVRDLALSGNVVCEQEGSSSSIGLLAGINTGMLENVSASGTIVCELGYNVGGVAGESFSPAVVSGVTSSVSLLYSSIKYGGGIVGTSTGTIQNSSASGSVAANFAGGIVGETNSLVQDSHASGNVSNNGLGEYGGGIAGSAQGAILRCFSTGAIDVRSYAGGLVGHGGGSLSIDLSFATGSVSARAGQAGGLLGGGAAAVTNSYARGAVNGGGKKAGSSGGLVGAVSAGITTSYSTGVSIAGKYRGGLAGNLSGPMKKTYWDLDTSGIADRSQGAGNSADYPGINGFTDMRLKSALPPGFDPAVWGQSASINDGYPYLLANPPPE